MELILRSPISTFHVAVALLSVVLGTWMLLTRKGTAAHRRVGYAYAVCMVMVNLTAFQLYHLFGRFGIVHVGAIVSLLTVIGGISVAVYRPVNWQRWHYRLMSASVTGLYAAGLVESVYRLFPATWFWGVCLGVSGLVFAVGAYLIGRHQPIGAVSLPEKAERNDNFAYDDWRIGSP